MANSGPVIAKPIQQAGQLSIPFLIQGNGDWHCPAPAIAKLFTGHRLGQNGHQKLAAHTREDRKVLLWRICHKVFIQQTL